MSGIYGTRDAPPKFASRSKSSPDGVLAAMNGKAAMEQKPKIPIITELKKIPYNMAVIERTRTRSINSEDAADETDEISKRRLKKKDDEQNSGSRCGSVFSSPDDLQLEKEILERNYLGLMQQLAAVLVEKETLSYQVQLLGQAYGELRGQFTVLAEQGNAQPSRLDCLRQERHRLADYIIALSALDSREAENSKNAISLLTQRDLWKHKFRASSLIVDELSSQRSFLLRQFEEAQQIITGLLNEKETVQKGLFDAFLYLQETKETLDPLDQGQYRRLAAMHSVNELLEANQDLARGLHKRLLNTTRTPSPRGAFADDTTDGSGPTVVQSEVEQQSRKIIALDVKTFASSNPCEDFQRLVNERAHAAGLPPPKVHNIVVNCCKHCQGQIKVL